MNFLRTLIVLLTGISFGFAQLNVQSTNFTVANGTVINTDTDVIIGDVQTFGEGTLLLTGSDQQISATDEKNLYNVIIAGGGIKTFAGDFNISNGLSLRNGLVSTAGGRLALVGLLDPQNRGNANSYVVGRLFRRYIGNPLLYPVGAGGRFTPVVINEAEGNNPVLAITPFNTEPQDVVLTTEIIDYSRSWHWDLSSPNADNFSGALLTIPFLNDDKNMFSEGGGSRPVVLHQTRESVLQNLGNASGSISTADSLLTASLAGGLGTYFVGEELFIEPVIHNVISPDGVVAADGMLLNEHLVIDNLSLYPQNEVLLVDRYGIQVFEATNYISPDQRSAPGEGVDFSFLSPGNYVCILKYTDPRSGEEFTMKQMVSVIKK